MRQDPRPTDPQPGRPAPEEIKKTTQPWLRLKKWRRDELQKRIEKLLTTKPPVPQRTLRKPAMAQA